jgi:hypothetical protein
MVSEALKPFLFVAAAIYIAVDELFSLLTQPIAAWLARRGLARRIRRWITSLPPYPALALFAVPLIVLEPVKPVAAYLAATGHFALGATLFVSGEIAKLLLVERLFDLNKHKLLSIPAFAWGYAHISALRDWLEATAVFRTVRRIARRIELMVRDLVDRWTSSDEARQPHPRAQVRVRRDDSTRKRAA